MVYVELDSTVAFVAPTARRCDSSFVLMRSKEEMRGEEERVRVMRGWLKRHANSREVLQRHSNYREKEQILEHLLHGVEQEVDPQRELDMALHFAGSSSGAPLPRGYRHDKSLQRTERFNTAIKRLQDYDGQGASDCSRWKGGLNAITLLTEYRRKVIFAAMLDTKEIVNEDRASARQKLDSYLSEYAPELLDSSFVEPGEIPSSEPLKLAQKSAKTQPINKQEKQKKKKNEQRAFEPKFGEYEVMKNRWRYVFPQTRQLARPNIVPRSPEKLVIIKNTPVRGTANETMDFVKRNSQLSN